MIIVLLVLIALAVLWFVLKDLMTAAGYLLGLVVILVGAALVLNIAWHLLLWALPTLIVGGCCLVIILCGAKLLAINRRQHRHRPAAGAASRPASVKNA